MADEHNTDTPPVETEFTPDESLEANDVKFETDAAAPGPESSSAGAEAPSPASQTVRDGMQKLAATAGDKARGYAEEGKTRATAALGEFSKMMNDAAGQVDDKFGAQYGQYARSAADYVTRLSDGLENKQVDELVEDVRGFVQKSPAVAIGAATAIGFVLARVLRSGIDAGRTDTGRTDA